MAWMTTSSPTHSSAKAFLAAFASALIPGVGQFIAGDRRKGAILVAIDVAFLAVLRIFFRDGLPYLTEGIVLDAPQTTFMLMLGLVVPLALRIWAADDAFRSVTEDQPNPVVTAFASAVVPGLGQIIASDRRKGVMLIAIDTVILVIFALFFRDEITVATHWLRPTSMALMMIANIVLLGFRIWAADDAYRTAAAQSRPAKSGSALPLVALGTAFVAVLLVPHVYFGYVDVVAYDLVTSVFDGPSSTTIAADPGTTSPPACRLLGVERK